MQNPFKRKKTAMLVEAEPTATGPGQAATRAGGGAAPEAPEPAAPPGRRALALYGAELDQETTLARELLDGRGLTYRYFDVTHDEGVRYMLRKRTDSKELPQIFVDDTPIGDYQTLRQIEYRGDLDRLLAGELDPADLGSDTESDDRGDLEGRDFETVKRRLREGETLALTAADGGTFDVWAEIFANPPQVYYEGVPYPAAELDRIVGDIVQRIETGTVTFAWKEDD